MNEWVLICNIAYFDLKKAFAEQKIISWPQDIPVKVGDNVYFYVSSPYGAILYKCEVQEINLFTMDGSSENYVLNAIFYNGIQKYMRLKLSQQYPENRYTTAKLREAGVGNLQQPFQVNAGLADLLQGKEKKQKVNEKNVLQKVILAGTGVLALAAIVVLVMSLSGSKTDQDSSSVVPSPIVYSETSEGDPRAEGDLMAKVTDAQYCWSGEANESFNEITRNTGLRTWNSESTGGLIELEPNQSYTLTVESCDDMDYMMGYILFSTADGTDLVKKDPMKNPGWTLISREKKTYTFTIIPDEMNHYLGVNFANGNRDNLTLDQENNIKYKINSLSLAENTNSQSDNLMATVTDVQCSWSGEANVSYTAQSQNTALRTWDTAAEGGLIELKENTTYTLTVESCDNMNYMMGYILFSRPDGMDLVKKDPVRNPGWMLISSDQDVYTFSITTDEQYRYLGINFANENRDKLTLDQGNNIQYKISSLQLAEASGSPSANADISKNVVQTAFEKPSGGKIDQMPAAYEAILKNTTGDNYYALLDITGDDQDELLLTTQAIYLEKTDEYLQDGYYASNFIEIYALNDGRASLFEELSNSMDYYKYNQATKSILGFWGGQGWADDIIYYANEGELTQRVLAYDIENEEFYWEDEKISKDTYDEYSEKWVNSAQYIVFEKNQYSFNEDQVPDGEYAVSFEGEDFFERNGDIYLTFEYYTYNLYDTDELLNLEPGDRIRYGNDEIYVESVDVETDTRDGKPFYTVCVNDNDYSYVTDISNPGYMRESEYESGPCYIEDGVYTAKLAKDVCFSDQSKNTYPSDKAQMFYYDDIVEYCREEYDGAFPLATKLTIENNEIVYIEHTWVS